LNRGFFEAVLMKNTLGPLGVIGPWLCFSKNIKKVPPHRPKKGKGKLLKKIRTSTIESGLTLVWKYVEKNSEFLIAHILRL
jgi:hypothetical protein